MIASLLQQPVLGGLHVAERGPRVRSPARDLTCAKVIGSTRSMGCRALELEHRALVERRRAFEPCLAFVVRHAALFAACRHCPRE